MIWCTTYIIVYNTVLVYSSVYKVAWFFLELELEAGAVGLALSYSITLMGMFQWGVRQSAEVENMVRCTLSPGSEWGLGHMLHDPRKYIYIYNLNLGRTPKAQCKQQGQIWIHFTAVKVKESGKSSLISACYTDYEVAACALSKSHTRYLFFHFSISNGGR